jgi:hypothetical protein
MTGELGSHHRDTLEKHDTRETGRQARHAAGTEHGHVANLSNLRSRARARHAGWGYPTAAPPMEV